MPPPVRIGDLTLPARARPVPFWRIQLGGGAGDLAARLRRGRAAAPGGLLGAHHEVQRVDVGGHGEDGSGSSSRVSTSLPSGVDHGRDAGLAVPRLGGRLWRAAFRRPSGRPAWRRGLRAGFLAAGSAASAAVSAAACGRLGRACLGGRLGLGGAGFVAAGLLRGRRSGRPASSAGASPRLRGLGGLLGLRRPSRPWPPALAAGFLGGRLRAAAGFFGGGRCGLGGLVLRGSAASTSGVFLVSSALTVTYP